MPDRAAKHGRPVFSSKKLALAQELPHQPFIYNNLTIYKGYGQLKKCSAQPKQ